MTVTNKQIKQVSKHQSLSQTFVYD